VLLELLSDVQVECQPVLLDSAVDDGVDHDAGAADS
jgi:hypothetical protein